MLYFFGNGSQVALTEIHQAIARTSGLSAISIVAAVGMKLGMIAGNFGGDNLSD
jgi:hypothetical protein